MPQTQNGYSYTNNNPINKIDPSGLCAENGDEACWSLAERLWLAQAGSLSELGTMDYRDLVLLQTYLTCASNSVFEGTHPVLKARACGMINSLEGQGFLKSSNPSDVINAGYRTPEDAHRLSTAYHSYYGFIGREELACTPVDSDGNVWYDKELERLFLVTCAIHSGICTPAMVTDDFARENAQKGEISTYECGRIRCGIAYAQEGYPPGDPRRLPNSDDVPVSNHVYGLAVDINGNFWTEKALEDIWSSQITNIARQFRLGRPFTEAYVERENARLRERGAGTQLQAEYWHFEPIDIERYR